MNNFKIVIALFLLMTSSAVYANTSIEEQVKAFYEAEMEAKTDGAQSFIDYRRANYSDNLHEIVQVVRTVNGEEQAGQKMERTKDQMMKTLEYAAPMMNYSEAKSDLLSLANLENGTYKSKVHITGHFEMNWPSTRVKGNVKEDMICEDTFEYNTDVSRLIVIESLCAADIQVIETKN